MLREARSFPQKVKSFPQKVKGFSSYQNQFPRKVKSMNIHFLTRSNERITISLEGQIIFFSQKSISSKGQMIFHLTFGGKKIPRKVKFDLQRLDQLCIFVCQKKRNETLSQKLMNLADIGRQFLLRC